MIDSHTHVDAEVFGEDRVDVLTRARDAGVTVMVDPGCDVPSSQQAVALAGQHADVYAAVGIHPHSAKETTDEAMETIRSLSHDPRVVAIGETGLDYHYEFSPRQQQLASLERHIELALERQLPLIIHCRAAEDDLLALLARTGAALNGGVIHCFTGTPDIALQLVDMGFYIGVTGIVTFKKSDQVQATATRVPLDRLLVETDAPYLAPIPHRGKRNEPSFLPHTVKFIAGLRGLSVDDLAQATADNARRLFRL